MYSLSFNLTELNWPEDQSTSIIYLCLVPSTFLHAVLTHSRWHMLCMFYTTGSIALIPCPPSNPPTIVFGSDFLPFNILGARFMPLNIWLLKCNCCFTQLHSNLNLINFLFLLKNSCPCQDLNPRPPRYQANMLSTELSWIGLPV